MEVPRRESVNPSRASQVASAQVPYNVPRPRRRIILCFDGTGNKFTGKDSDSNILKIYRMLDRTNGDKHYYQPGIGTYVKGALSHTSTLSKMHSWIQKTKDSAVGTSFDDHVMGAYKFLMSCYDEDDIYFFGFSRGAYVARFLAEMLDHVGLLSQGNEEMARFAWKAFASWQQREEGTDEEKQKKAEMLEFLQAFRDTFSRPVRRIRFLGLFDTVNSVPRFESAWMQRSKFPYTARSSAKVIRHAVSIDERRAKFRSDLITSTKKKILANPISGRGRENKSKPMIEVNGKQSDAPNGAAKLPPTGPDRFRRRSHVDLTGRSTSPYVQDSALEKNYLDTTGNLMASSRSPSREAPETHTERESIRSGASSYLPAQIRTEDDVDEDEAMPQDIEELWFPGGHGDLGGGWILDEMDTPLSHVPLVWMVREAQRAGLEFDSEQMLKLKCCDDNFTMEDEMPTETIGAQPGRPQMPDIQVTGASTGDIFQSPRRENSLPGWAPGFAPRDTPKTNFQKTLDYAMTKSILHDVLLFGSGLSTSQVLAWKFMEYLPFRRMDLRPDGSWKAISLPLPMGETRDIPADAHIHHSAILRMKADENYRPGNLIIGGGGRGVRKTPKELGMGSWEVFKDEYDQIGCIYVRKGESIDTKIDRGEGPQMAAAIAHQEHQEKKQGALLTREGP